MNSDRGAICLLVEYNSSFLSAYSSYLISSLGFSSSSFYSSRDSNLAKKREREWDKSPTDFVLNCCDAPGEIKVHFALHDSRHDEFGVENSNLGLENVRDNVQIVLASDDQVDGITIGFVDFSNLLDVASTFVLDAASSSLYHKFQLLPRRKDARSQVKYTTLERPEKNKR